ncbi:hypothetical protein F444_07121 [Phytophthora nicotianae P1976]|uniref:Uncharacterized protein n=1 Tax=Phytophthora nicotianae P1976 TaxID=1317066 RepID=A0A081AFP8_PHYNI|nr:hypothetical protein F444_07121 [Phytophthora nicotianae P1976]
MGRMLCATGTTATTSEPRRDPARGAAVHNAPAIPAPATTPPPQPGAPHRRRRHNWVARRRKSCEARRAPFLLKVGEGRHDVITVLGKEYMKLPRDMLINAATEEENEDEEIAPGAVRE